MVEMPIEFSTNVLTTGQKEIKRYVSRNKKRMTWKLTSAIMAYC